MRKWTLPECIFQEAKIYDALRELERAQPKPPPAPIDDAICRIGVKYANYFLGQPVTKPTTPYTHHDSKAYFAKPEATHKTDADYYEASLSGDKRTHRKLCRNSELAPHECIFVLNIDNADTVYIVLSEVRDAPRSRALEAPRLVGPTLEQHGVPQVPQALVDENDRLRAGARVRLGPGVRGLGRHGR